MTDSIIDARLKEAQEEIQFLRERCTQLEKTIAELQAILEGLREPK